MKPVIHSQVVASTAFPVLEVTLEQFKTQVWLVEFQTDPELHEQVVELTLPVAPGMVLQSRLQLKELAFQAKGVVQLQVPSGERSTVVALLT